jgi:hypothetical protein
MATFSGCDFAVSLRIWNSGTFGYFRLLGTWFGQFLNHNLTWAGIARASVLTIESAEG